MLSASKYSMPSVERKALLRLFLLLLLLLVFGLSPSRPPLPARFPRLRKPTPQPDWHERKAHNRNRYQFKRTWDHIPNKKFAFVKFVATTACVNDAFQLSANIQTELSQQFF